MANKPKKNKKSTNSADSKEPLKNKEPEQEDSPTWQQIAEARKPVAQKAIELLDDPTKHLIRPKEEILIQKEIKIKTQPTPTHTIVTELSTPRRIIGPSIVKHSPKKVLKSEITHQETRTLTPEEINNLKKARQQSSTTHNEEEVEDELFSSIKKAAHKLMKVFNKKKPGSK